MLKNTFILILCFFTFNCIAQKTVISNGEFLLRIEKNWTEEFAVLKAKEKAQINAIENAFGAVIVQGNAIYVKEVTSSSQTKSDMVFTSIGNVLVNGEWLSTIDEKIQFKDSVDYRWVKAIVKGKVRELNKILFTPEVATLSCNQQKCSTEVFNSGQELVVYFKAPTNGFVTIYLDDSKQAQRLLPYSHNSSSTTFQVKADQAYYFFSKTDAKQKNVDEVELFTESTMEQNNLYILFSKFDFDKPLLNATKLDEVDNTKYTLPASMEITKFQTWLQGMRSFNRNIELKTILLTIKK
jgi:hypothetical protein